MSSDAVGWAFFAYLLGVLSTACVLGAVHLFIVHRRGGKGLFVISNDVRKVHPSPDPELGECRSAQEKSKLVHPLTPTKLLDSFKSLLETELPKGLASSGLADQLDRLEKKVSICDVSVAEHPIGLRGAGRASMDIEPPVVKGLPQPNADEDTPSTSDRSGCSNREAMLDSLKVSAQFTQDSELSYGPTDRQMCLRDPPEKLTAPVDEEASAQQSLRTVQKVLKRRDAQTSELHRQLRDARQSLWLQTVEARTAKANLQELISNPAHAPEAQAEAIQKLRLDVSELSGRLADTSGQSKYWRSIAKRQRAFFMQNESIGDEGRTLLKRHPAGDVFLATAPVLPEDDDDDEHGSGWDVGGSHCNPYKVDSWPAEPNVMAQRTRGQATMEQCPEGEDEEGGSQSEDEGDDLDEDNEGEDQRCL